MKQTALLSRLLERAETVRQECGGETVGAYHIAAAMVEFCATEYIGFAATDNSVYPNWYEEERLRLIDERVLKTHSYFRLRLRRAVREGTPLPAFELARCERVAAARENDVLSADLVFLCVLAALMPACRPVYRVAVTDDTILPLLTYVDEHIFDYTAKRVEAVCDKLMEKARMAAYKRDWRPAAKFAEPEEAVALLFGRVDATKSGDVLTLRLHRFFGACDLKLSIHRVGIAYYVHDNGCALRYLAKRVADPTARERMVRRVCHPCYRDRNRLTGRFTNTYCFFEYLRRLVFVAHADLYYTRADREMRARERGYAYIGADRAEPLDEAHLLTLLREGVGCYYDEDRGLCLRLDAPCSVSTPRTYVNVETRADGTLRLTERKRGPYEGEIFENFFWNNDDITPYAPYLSRWTERFGAALDGRDVYLTARADRFGDAVFRFFSLAVLLTEFGHGISLPKLRKRGG